MKSETESESVINNSRNESIGIVSMGADTRLIATIVIGKKAVRISGDNDILDGYGRYISIEKWRYARNG